MTIEIVGNPTFEETLMHFGVKGMKWGQRKSVTTSDIKSARLRFDAKNTQLQADTKKAIATTKKGTAARTKAMTKLQKQRVSVLKNPDRATALRMTRGEKRTTAAKAFGLSFLGPVGQGQAAKLIAEAGVRTIERKVVEKKQRSGAYDKRDPKNLTKPIFDPNLKK